MKLTLSRVVSSTANVATMTDSFAGTTGYGYNFVHRSTRITTASGRVYDTEYDLVDGRLDRTAHNAVQPPALG